MYVIYWLNFVATNECHVQQPKRLKSDPMTSVGSSPNSNIKWNTAIAIYGDLDIIVKRR